MNPVKWSPLMKFMVLWFLSILAFILLEFRHQEEWTVKVLRFLDPQGKVSTQFKTDEHGRLLVKPKGQTQWTTPSTALTPELAQAMHGLRMEIRQNGAAISALQRIAEENQAKIARQQTRIVTLKKEVRKGNQP